MYVLTIVGARPQFVKAAMLERAMDNAYGISSKVIHTGQHYDANMSDIFFDELGLRPPSHHLGIGSGTHGVVTGRMIEMLESVLYEERPDWVLVVGDTNSTLAAALAAAKLNVPIAHVGAGLRSGNRKMPEEINRVLTDHVSELLFAPSKRAAENLYREGLADRGVHVVGDVMYDATLAFRHVARTSVSLDRWGLHESEYILSTIHRQENTDDPERLTAIFDGLYEIAATIKVVMPLHPRTKRAVGDNRIKALGKRIGFIEPVSYLEMHRLLMDAGAVLTDSGGLQKEAYFHGVPCVTARDETEWTETVESGWNQVVGGSTEAIVSSIHATIGAVPSHARAPLYGAGNASTLIVERLLAQV